MMLQIAFDIATIILLCCVGVGALLFNRRISRLRDAIAEAGQVLPKLDAAVVRMNDAANGFSNRIQGEMQVVEARVNSAKQLASELTGTSHSAEDLIIKLEQHIRQAKRLERDRQRTIPRELAEPKGFAEQYEDRLAYTDPQPRVEAAQPAARMEPAGRIEPQLDVQASPRGVSRFATRRSTQGEQDQRERTGILSAGAFNSFSSVEA